MNIHVGFLIRRLLPNGVQATTPTDKIENGTQHRGNISLHATALFLHILFAL